MTGRLIVIVAASGAGKDTLLASAAAARPDLHLVRRVITRPAALGGEGFDGVDEAEFERRRQAGGFAVWWAAHGLRYGVPVEVRRRLARGETVLLNGSRDALPEIRAVFPDLSLILIVAPKDALRERLVRRGRETEAEIDARLARADRPTPAGALVVRNDGTVEGGVARLLAAIQRCASGGGFNGDPERI